MYEAPKATVVLFEEKAVISTSQACMNGEKN